jgi:hypothetical protein
MKAFLVAEFERWLKGMDSVSEHKRSWADWSVIHDCALLFVLASSVV